MNNPTLTKQIESILTNICENENFSKSPRNVRLLKFLVEHSLKGDFIKEQVIGIELFGAKYNPLKNDGKVRVYMFNLRKKLDEYYEKDGKNDKLIFEIEKGQYNVSFVKRSESKPAKRMQKTLLFSIIGLVSVLIAVTAVVLLNKNKRERYCWNSFLHANTETVCLISDHKILSTQLPDSTNGFVRHTGINNDYDLTLYLSKHKEANYQVSNFSFLTKMAPVATQQLTYWFSEHKKKYSILLESELSFEAIRSKNLIQIGQWKTLDKTKTLLLNNSSVFNIVGDTIIYNDGNKYHKYQSYVTSEKYTDYTIVSFKPKENGSEVLSFFSNNDVGVIASVKKFTDTEWLSDFYKSFPENTKYFNALIRAKGINRTEQSFELVEIEYIETAE